MHIENIPKHRHFLAVPLAIAVLVSTVWTTSIPMRAATAALTQVSENIVATGAEKSVAFADGTYGSLHEDGVLAVLDDTVILRDGVVLLASRGVVRLQAGSARLTGFHGGFVAILSGEKLTVLALTTPVVLHNGTFTVIIPSGMQGEWMLADIPAYFDLQASAAERHALTAIAPSIVRASLERLHQLTPAPLPALPTATVEPSLLAPIRLPAAEERAAAAAGESLLAELRSAVAEETPAHALALLADASLQKHLFSSDAPPDAIPVLLAEAAHLPSVVQELLQYVSDADLWLLTSLHPGYHGSAWELAVSPLGMTRHTRELRELLFPSSDVAETYSPRASDRWKRQVHLSLAGSSDPAYFINALLTSMAGYRAFAEEHAYPERLRRYAAALHEIVQPYENDLSDDARALFADWQDVDAIAPYIDPPAPVTRESVVASSSSSSVESEPFDPAVVQAQAKQRLQSAGALFTLETRIEAVSATEASISRIIFASMSGEHSYDFTINLATNQAETIFRDGQTMPYALSLDAFAQWAKAE